MKILFTIIALLYVLNPYDLVPDFLLGWGWLDDLLVGLFVWWIYNSLQRSRQKRRVQEGPHATGSENGQGEDQSTGDHAGRRAEGQKAPDDPYDTLCIDRSASVDEIKSAYRKLAAKYHPDKVAHLGQEFGQLAEQRFKEIQQAYQQIMSEKKG